MPILAKADSTFHGQDWDPFDAQVFYDAISYQDSQFVGSQHCHAFARRRPTSRTTLSTQYSLSLLSVDGRSAPDRSTPNDPERSQSNVHREEGTMSVAAAWQITAEDFQVKCTRGFGVGALQRRYTNRIRLTAALGRREKLGWQVTARLAPSVSTGIDYCGVDYSPDSRIPGNPEHHGLLPAELHTMLLEGREILGRPHGPTYEFLPEHGSAYGSLHRNGRRGEL